MKVMGKQQVDVVTDILCDVCGNSTSGNGSHPPQLDTLYADWGYGSRHDGEAYEVHLCEGCFFGTLAGLKEQRRGNMVFSEEGYDPDPEFGLLSRSQGRR